MNKLRWDLPLQFRGQVNGIDCEWLHNQAKSQAGQELFVIAMTQGKTNGTWLELGCGHPIGSNNTFLLEKKLDWSGISIDTEDMGNNIVTPYEEYWGGFYQGFRQPEWPEHTVPFSQLPERFQNRFESYYNNFIKRQQCDIDLIPSKDRNWKTARPRTEFYKMNAFEFDYDKIPSRVDYLQVDLHPSTANLEILDKLLPNRRFSAITFEHDVWDRTKESDRVRKQSREILKEHGYDLVISDATVPPGHGNGIGDEPINFEDWWADPQVIDQQTRDCYRNLIEDGQPKYYFNTLFEKQN
jgi:hypothetical protein